MGHVLTRVRFEPFAPPGELVQVAGLGRATPARGRGLLSGGGGASVLFHSDWSTATGTDDPALTDGGKWAREGQGGDIIPSTGLDFPTANVFRVPWDDQNNPWPFLRKTGLPIPGVGESRYYRWYYRSAQPDGTSDPETHPIQDGEAAGNTNWMWKHHNDVGNGVWRVSFYAGGNTSTYAFFGPILNKNQTYRIELGFTRLTATHHDAHIRMYNSSDVLIANDDNFFNSTDESGPTLTEFLQSQSIPYIDVNNFDGLNCGTNDGGPEPFSLHSYQGAFVVRANDWAGPYANGI